MAITHTLRTTVTGGYNGGALINIFLDDVLIFTATGSSPYNLDYNVKEGEFSINKGNVFINVTPPVNSTSLLYIEYSGVYENSLSINHVGNNTSYGYNFEDTSIIDDIDPEPEPPDPPEPPVYDMIIKLYKNNSEKNVLNKDITNELSFSGVLRESTSIKTPVIKFYSDSSIINYNYAYIELFSRYYFITDITSIRNGLWEVSFLCDVLMSFRDDILNTYGVIADTETYNTNNYLESETWRTLVKDKTDIINFSGSGLLDSGEYILITAGG